MPPKLSPGNARKGEWGQELVVHTPPQRVAPVRSIIANADLKISDGVQRTSKPRRRLFCKHSSRTTDVTSLPQGSFTVSPLNGFFSGTWAYHPYASVSTTTMSNQQAATAPVMVSASSSETTKTEEPDKSDKSEPHSRPFPPAREMCAGCDRETVEMYCVWDLGYVCSECMAHSARRL